MNDQVINDFSSTLSLFDANRLILLALGFFAIYWLNKIIRYVLDRLMEKVPSSRFTLLQIATLLSFIIYIVGSLTLIIVVLDPPKEFLIGAGGSIAVAVGIALKDVVASMIAGLVLLFDRPFTVGDRVSFDDYYGEIVSIGLRSVRLNTLDDNLITIPNSRFINEAVSSGNAGALEMMVVCDMHFALHADITQVKNILREVIVTSRFAYLKKPVSFVVAETVVAERLALKVSAKAYVLDIHYEKAFQTDVITRSAILLTKHKIPRPSRDS